MFENVGEPAGTRTQDPLIKRSRSARFSQTFQAQRFPIGEWIRPRTHGTNRELETPEIIAPGCSSAGGAAALGAAGRRFESGHPDHCVVAQMVERPAVNRAVAGSSPADAAIISPARGHRDGWMTLPFKTAVKCQRKGAAGQIACGGPHAIRESGGITSVSNPTPAAFTPMVQRSKTPDFGSGNTRSNRVGGAISMKTEGR